MDTDNNVASPKRSIHFTCGGEDRLADLEYGTNEASLLDTIRTFIRERFHQKNVYFLFGSGTSATALPTMSRLYEEVKALFSTEKNITGSTDCDIDDCKLFNEVKQRNDLEKTLGILYSLERYQEGCKTAEKGVAPEALATTKRVIQKIQNHIYKALWHPTLEDLKADQSEEQKKFRSTLDTYKAFYQKVVYRNKDLSRVHIFTTNNDLFNEAALDELGILYTNGFTPGLQRFFNPALFNFTYSKRMDVSIDKYEPIDNMVYLYKLHGSVNWRDLQASTSPNSSNKLFSIQEVYSNEDSPNTMEVNDVCLVYPAPTKQNLSLGSPYVDLIRLFQEKLLEHNSVLFVCGYSFSDEHINNVIYRALAVNASLNLVILNDLKDTHPLRKTGDSRVYNIWSDCPEEKSNDANQAEGKKEEKKGINLIHFFSEVVGNLLTALDQERSDTVSEELVKMYSAHIHSNK
jgi:hypothetical protein